MMKRLIRKSDNQNDNSNNEKNNIINESPEQTNSNTIEKLREEVMEDARNENDTNMVLLNQLDEADVRHDKCPQCKKILVRKDGYKVCPNCGMVYKMIDGSGYIVLE